jgi:hypothetical protein
MKTPHALLALCLVSLLAPAMAGDAGVVSGAGGTPAPDADEAGLQPFIASYQALNAGKPAGTATMRLAREPGQWRVALGITGDRGMARLMKLDIDQDTLFDERDGRYRPLRQSTVRKALFFGRKIQGSYDWDRREARWTGDIKEARRAPVALRDGDMSGLLINLAIVRDAEPGRTLHYRFVDGGRVRDHEYAVATDSENVVVDGLSYDAMRVSRTNGGNDETIFWVARGVPTPVRILQRDDGQDAIDLRLTAYQGVH